MVSGSLFTARTRGAVPTWARGSRLTRTPGSMRAVPSGSWMPSSSGARIPSGFPPKVERFTAADQSGAPPTRFEVQAARSGISTVVGTQETIVTALRRVGVDVLTSCAQGVCGTCETDVLAGRPDHRDSLLDDAERTASDCMFPCVSRSRDSLLVLDI